MRPRTIVDALDLKISPTIAGLILRAEQTRLRQAPRLPYGRRA